ncbi:MAG: MarR family transcriptional regulator [Deltaproteobacteria bacterium]|nr:MarR family transcriptional regulator [Deltaproteobacteria bacterium]
MLPRQEYIGLLIGTARRRLKQAVEAQVSEHGLSTRQFWTLVSAHELQGASLGELAERQNTDLPTISRVVAQLAALGLVVLERDPGDRRRAILGVTPRGRVLAKRMQKIADEVRGVTVKGLSAPEQEHLRGLLKRVIGNLDSLAVEPRRAGKG